MPDLKLSEFEAITLEPGKTYVIQMSKRFASQSDFDCFRKMLDESATGCRFVILDEGARLVTTAGESTLQKINSAVDRVMGPAEVKGA